MTWIVLSIMSSSLMISIEMTYKTLVLLVKQNVWMPAWNQFISLQRMAGMKPHLKYPFLARKPDFHLKMMLQDLESKVFTNESSLKSSKLPMEKYLRNRFTPNHSSYFGNQTRTDHLNVSFPSYIQPMQCSMRKQSSTLPLVSLDVTWRLLS